MGSAPVSTVFRTLPVAPEGLMMSSSTASTMTFKWQSVSGQQIRYTLYYTPVQDDLDTPETLTATNLMGT